jgi:hypothetical protein
MQCNGSVTVSFSLSSAGQLHCDDPSEALLDFGFRPLEFRIVSIIAAINQGSSPAQPLSAERWFDEASCQRLGIADGAGASYCSSCCGIGLNTLEASICSLFLLRLDSISKLRSIMSSQIFSLLAFAATTLAQSLPPGVSSPVAKKCGPSTANIVCLDRYASVLPYHFFRNVTVDFEDPIAFGSTSVPNDTSFGLVKDADFLVFDQARAFELLGESPTIDFVFELSTAIHEAPVYVPGLNKLFFSQLSPEALPQYVVDLNQDPPTLSEYSSDPPVYAPNGGTFHNGLIYWSKIH